jgi:hypothetical protein
MKILSIIFSQLNPKDPKYEKAICSIRDIIRNVLCRFGSGPG